MLSFEGEQFLGSESILGKLNSLGKVAHQMNTLDSQPTMNNGIITMVNGDLSIDGGPPIKFTQVFNLAPGGSAGYYCHNDIFRLALD